MTIDLPIQKYDGWRVVRAELLDIAPHLPVSFAVHKTPWNDYGYTVSNVETGSRVSSGLRKREAINIARVRLRKKTARQYLAAERFCCKHHRQILDTSIIAPTLPPSGAAK